MQPKYYVKPGDLITHYKGGQYIVLCVSHNEANPEEMLVTYLDAETARPWTRELSQFNELIKPEGSEEEVVRFEPVGEVQVLVNAGEPYGDFAVVALK